MTEDSARLNIYSGDENGTPGSDNMGSEQPVNAGSKNAKILNELNRIFEDRLKDIDTHADGDSKLRSRTYKDWVDVLIRLIKDLFGTVQELEYEACQRVKLLENRLETCKIYHSASDSLRKDFNILLELVRKAYEMHRWEVEGLKFNTLTLEQIFGDKIPSTYTKIDKEKESFAPQDGSSPASQKQELTSETSQAPEESNVDIEARGLDVSHDDVFKFGMSSIKEILQTKDNALEKAQQENQTLKEEITKLKKSAFDQEKALVNQRALAIEVADKYDQILHMRDEINLLEEEVKKAHKKIQLKDDVIRELRKESKIGFKIYPSPPMDVNTTDSSNISMKMLTEIGLEHLSMAAEKETDYINRLKEELEEFFKQQHSQQETFEDQRRLSLSQQSLLRDLVNRLGLDLQKSRAKQLYIQSKLLEIIGDQQSLDVFAECASGYLFQEDLQNEDSTIKRVSGCILGLRIENYELLTKIQKLNEDIDGINTSMRSMAKKVDCNEKILHKVACALTNIYGKEIPCVMNENEDIEVHPLCKAMENLQSEICEQRSMVKCLQDTVLKKDTEIIRLVDQNSTTQHDCEIKNRTIAELQKTIATNENAMEKLLSIRKELEEQLNRQESLVHNTESIVTKLKAEKVELEREHCSDLETGVLRELFSDIYAENMRLERTIELLRNENLYWKEMVFEFKTNYSYLEKDYILCTQMLIEAVRSGAFSIRYRPASSSRRQTTAAQQEESIPSQSTNMADTGVVDHKRLYQNGVMDGNDIQGMDMDRSYRELQTQNDLLQNTIETLEANNRALTLSLKNNEFEIIKLKKDNTSLQSDIKEKAAKFEEISSLYNTLYETLQVQKVRCSCGASEAITLDDIHLETYKMKSVDTVFDALERRTNELEAIKKYSSEEKNRLTTVNWELEDKIKQGEIKISLLEKSIQKRDEELREANKRLLGYPDKEQEKHYKEIITKLTEDISNLTAAKRERDQELSGEISKLHQSLSKSNETILNLEKQINTYRKHGDFITKENAFLKADLFKMREGLAHQEGIEKGVRDQLQKTQTELAVVQLDLERSIKLNEEMENIKKNCSRLKDANYDLVRKYNDLGKDYNALQEEYRLILPIENIKNLQIKLIDVKETLLKEIELTRQWKQEQTDHDKLIKAKLDQQAETIATLMEDRENLISKVNELYRDACLIGSELEHYKDAFEDSLNDTRTKLMFGSDVQLDNVDAVIRRIKRTTVKLAQTRSIWQDGLRRSSH